MKKIFYSKIAIVSILVCSNCFAQTSQDAQQQEKTSQLLTEIHQRQKNVGLSVVVMLKGKIVYSEEFGFADLEHKVPVTKNTRFQVASTTKAFTGAALLKLFEAKKIDLDADIRTVIPDFPKKSETAITPNLLAKHLAGIRHYNEGEKTYTFLNTHYKDLSEAIKIFKDDELTAQPNTNYGYSSFGYDLLALTIEKSAGKPFIEYVNEAIFKPLNLKNTMYDDVRFVVPNRARLYSFYDPLNFAPSEEILRVPEFDYSYNMGGGNLLITGEDLARFGQAFVKEGFFKKETLDMFYTKQSELSPWSYGFFVREKTEKEDRRIHITGAFPGVQSGLFVYPEDELVIAILSNTWGVNSNSAELVVGVPAKISEIWKN